MGEEILHVINTTDLFIKLNEKRKAEQHDEVEHHLIASKLGILFALNSNSYVNFKSEFVELNDAQLKTLDRIFGEHFNTEMSAEIHAMVMTPSQMEEEIASHIPKSNDRHIGFFGKLRSLFSGKPKLA
ncbi:hypothetical protein [Candidatus Albibeggiatoa sp. nov. NOAA]|uniref:hypothetical protein n=1 Tax=Candidatus Albibeggiatoa sp. nov. NOAA TaxID=3162724 RepID=UPI0032F7972F|nr:hypothetical protein [Thiotrichaceae bacterium]